MSAGRYFQLCRVLLPLTAAAAFAACSSSNEYGAPFAATAQDAGAADAATQPRGTAGRSSTRLDAGHDAQVDDDADSGNGSGNGLGGSAGVSGQPAANSGGRGGSSGARAHAGTGGAAAGAAGHAGLGGTGGNAGGAGGSGGAGTGGQPAAVTFSDIYTGILATGCNCHNGGAGGLDLATRAIAYTNLVDVPSSNCIFELRVAPGDANASVLLHSLAHTSPAACTVPTMPRGGTPLSQAQLDQVRAWINAGALDN